MTSWKNNNLLRLAESEETKSEETICGLPLEKYDAKLSRVCRHWVNKNSNYIGQVRKTLSFYNEDGVWDDNLANTARTKGNYEYYKDTLEEEVLYALNNSVFPGYGLLTYMEYLYPGEINTAADFKKCIYRAYKEGYLSEDHMARALKPY